MFEYVKEYSRQSCSQWIAFLPSILPLFQFVIAACLVKSLIAQYKHKADLFIMEGINTSSEVTYFHWDARTVDNGIIYLSKTYQIHLSQILTTGQYLFNQLCRLPGRNFFGTLLRCFRTAVTIITLIWDHWVFPQHMLEKL